MKAFYEKRIYQTEIPVSAHLSENLDFVAHWHTDIEMIYVCEGKIGVGINSEYKVLEKGGIAICGSNDIHYYRSGNGMFSTIIIVIFKPELFVTFEFWPRKLLPCSRLMDLKYISGQGVDNGIQCIIKSSFINIVEEMEQKKDLYPIFTSLGISNLFLYLLRYFPDYQADCKSKYNCSRISVDLNPMQKALRFLEENYTQNITLDQIAKEINLSRFYFSRLFKKTTGMNFNSYLTRIRIEKAESMINTTGKTILEIAYETGFRSIRTFNRAFKEIKACAPHSLRKSSLL